jgi:hypothetical protein
VVNVEGGEAPDKEQLGSASVSSDGPIFYSRLGMILLVEKSICETIQIAPCPCCKRKNLKDLSKITCPAPQA